MLLGKRKLYVKLTCTDGPEHWPQCRWHYPDHEAGIRIQLMDITIAHENVQNYILLDYSLDNFHKKIDKVIYIYILILIEREDQVCKIHSSRMNSVFSLYP